MFVKNRNCDVLKRVAIEIVAPSITLSIEKFTQSSGDGKIFSVYQALSWPLFVSVFKGKADGLFVYVMFEF